MEVRVLPAPQIRSVLQLVDGSDLESGFCEFESHPIDKIAGMLQLEDGVVSKAISCGFESLFRYTK